MQPLFSDHKKHAYVLIMTLVLSSVFFATRATGLVTSASSNALVDMAFSSELVKDFAASNPDFRLTAEELTPDKLAELQQESPQMYSNIPPVKMYQLILDASGKAIIVLLNEDAVFKTWEVNLAKP